MNKLFLMLLLFVMGYSQATAQVYIPFVREGVKWVCSYKDYSVVKTFTYNLELKGDVEINGKTYKAMHKYSGEEINWEEDTVPVYLREEDKVVYGIVPDGKTYLGCPVGISNDQEMMGKIAAGEEFVLYDFNNPVKFIEAWLEIPEFYNFHCTVIPDMAMVAGNEAKRYISSFGSTDFCMIEGIGYDGRQNAYPLAVYAMAYASNCPVWLCQVEENGEVIYSSESRKPRREYIPQIPREGVQWVNERVVIDHGEMTKSYYVYEFKGEDLHHHPICYKSNGGKLDPEGAEAAAVFWTPYECSPIVTECLVYENKPLGEVHEQRRDMINGIWEGNLYKFSQTYSDVGFTNTVNYYIMNQTEEFLTRENFFEVEPLVIEGMECRRYAYVGDDGEPLAYITEGIGFDSRDMGDLLTPFTRKPDPDAEYQEYWGLSHVIKDGEIIYKGMRYDPSLFEGSKGDVNGDGKLTIADVTALIDLLLRDDVMFRSPCDLDDNGSLSIADVTALIDLLLSDAE